MPALDDTVVERDRRDLHGRTPILGHEHTSVTDTPAAMAGAKGLHGRPTALLEPSSRGLGPRHETSEPDRVVGAAELGSRPAAGAGPAPAGPGRVATRAPDAGLWSTAAEL